MKTILTSKSIYFKKESKKSLPALPILELQLLFGFANVT